jgi:hypothetical protein
VNGNTTANIATKPIASTTATVSSNAGEYDITCSGGTATNYDFIYETGKLNITKAPLTVSVSNASRNYGSENPTFNITYSGFRNSETKTVLTVQPQAVTTATNTSNVGTYPIIISGGEALNYEFSYVSGTLTINKVNVTVVANSVSFIYGDVPQYSCQYIGFVNGEAEEVLTSLPIFTCSATSQSNAGNYAITPSGAEAQNYTFAYQPGTLTIQKRNLRVIPDNALRVYGNTNPAFTLSYAGFVNGNTAADIAIKPTASTSATIYSNVGEYDIRCSGGNATNYSFTYETGSLTIEKANLTIQAQDEQRKAGEPNPAFTLLYSGFKNNENQSVLDELPAISCSANSNSPAGFYDIVLSGGSDNNYNYQLVNGKLEVINGTGIKDVEMQIISIYPNPAKHDLFIKSDSSIEKVEIYNLSGLRVLTENNFAEKIDVSHLEEGIYFVRITADSTIATKKIIIQK